MSIFSRISLLLLPLLCACSFYEYTPADDSADDPTSSTLPTEKYINLSIVVSSGNEGTTRANPNGGEEGDGREAGLTRENEVTGITLMLYQTKDGQGINTADAENTNIAFIKYYPVTNVSREPAGTGYTEKTDEAVYKTGEQPLGKDLDLAKEYHAIVVANMDLTRLFNTESTTVKDVRDHIVTKIYQGTGIGINAQNFVMSLETDYKFNFTDVIPERKENKLIYNFDNIRIERLAARVDFWMNNATYNADYNTPGYVYEVNGSDDKFVLTAVMPFNLYDNDHEEAKEYLFKHVNAGTGTIQYLIEETNSSLVIDPNTDEKSSLTVAEYYHNPLETLVVFDKENQKLNGAGVAALYQTTANLYQGKPQNQEEKENQKETQWAKFDGAGEYDNFILCYPKENALQLASPLYYYATGVAIEGDYYKNGTDEPEHYVYYGFLRHQGEGYTTTAEHYPIKTAEQLLSSKSVAGNQGIEMNFGVVRNNIYRISIDGISKKGEEETPTPPEITLQIKVKKWDTFTHSTIYM